MLNDSTAQLEANKAVVRQFLAVFSTGNLEGILMGMHPDATWWVSGTIEGISGSYTREQFGSLLRAVKDVYKAGALRITPGEMTAEGNRVAVEAESYGELKNGRTFSCRYHFLFVVVDGKIASAREYLDTKHLFDVFVAP